MTYQDEPRLSLHTHMRDHEAQTVKTGHHLPLHDLLRYALPLSGMLVPSPPQSDTSSFGRPVRGGSYCDTGRTMRMQGIFPVLAVMGNEKPASARFALFATRVRSHYWQ